MVRILEDRNSQSTICDANYGLSGSIQKPDLLLTFNNDFTLREDHPGVVVARKIPECCEITLFGVGCMSEAVVRLNVTPFSDCRFKGCKVLTATHKHKDYQFWHGDSGTICWTRDLYFDRGKIRFDANRRNNDVAVLVGMVIGLYTDSKGMSAAIILPMDNVLEGVEHILGGNSAGAPPYTPTTTTTSTTTTNEMTTSTSAVNTAVDVHVGTYAISGNINIIITVPKESDIKELSDVIETWLANRKK